MSLARAILNYANFQEIEHIVYYTCVNVPGSKDYHKRQSFFQAHPAPGICHIAQAALASQNQVLASDGQYRHDPRPLQLGRLRSAPTPENENEVSSESDIHALCVDAMAKMGILYVCKKPI
jgi:hypothetical protein